jgi:hypothetical protein
MSYDPSHPRRPPRQERWPQATPPEAWQAYQEDDAYQGESPGRVENQGAYWATSAVGYRSQPAYQGASGGPAADPGYRGYPPPAPDPFAGTGGDYPGAPDYYGDATGGYPALSGGYAAGPDDYAGYAAGPDDYAGYAAGPDDYAGYAAGPDDYAGCTARPGGQDGDGYGYGGASGGYADRPDGYDGYDGYAGGYGEPQDGFDGAQVRHYRPAAGYAGPQDGYAGARDGYAGVPAGYAGARDGYAGVPAGYAGAANGYAGARDGDQGTTGGYRLAGNGYAPAGNGRGRAPDDYFPGDELAENDFAADDAAGPAGYLDRDDYAEAGSFGAALAAPDAGIDPASWQAGQDRRREAGRRGLIVGAVTGLLAAAVAIGTATLAAAVVRPEGSPISAAGRIFIDRIPATLKNAVVAHFGVHAHTVLLLGMYVMIGVLALGIGVLARRSAGLGVAGVAALSLGGAYVAITRPGSQVSDVIPSIFGGLAGVAALLWLLYASAPVPAIRQARGSGSRRAR